uniref:Uncharacterized protein n=1 Tax=Arundo donax TaxID=35708 RepID=A0A0A9ALN5_ARUDO
MSYWRISLRCFDLWRWISPSQPGFDSHLLLIVMLRGRLYP